MIDEKPVPYKIIRDFGGTSESYVGALVDVISNLKSEHDINVISFVTDNLRAQISAIKEIIEMNELKDIFYISCSNHALSLATMDLAIDGLDEGIVSNIYRFSIFLRKKPIRNFIRCTCPLWINSRWNILFTTSYWVINHISIILSLKSSPKELYDMHIKDFRQLYDQFLLEDCLVECLAFHACSQILLFL